MFWHRVCFQPGIVRSQFGAFGSDLGLLFRIAFVLSIPFSKSPEEGADSLVWLATSKEAAPLKGEYVTNRRVTSPQKQAMDPKLAADLWTLSEKLCAEAMERDAK